mmetsp:Transcript_269/g.278  ORF Transcript_269/g.278 Transcript_269/m.278 type:complete len:339 (+) Transcript_269:117-1133(+)|eukprot:CAMPEP_0184032388 /NCGR_PEP_ID=MMETSP0955-20130417/2980_1 /TAXON_ID=627963 /ORGANISM="Aplanochytrium sp, Strain PBS07" /LENGTH=338 /DNA_ID=CAMNT_0026318431 /DNA_START=97 /DNA_END=1113 /DNA_ORIENTATION=+
MFRYKETSGSTTLEICNATAKSLIPKIRPLHNSFTTKQDSFEVCDFGVASLYKALLLWTKGKKDEADLCLQAAVEQEPNSVVIRNIVKLLKGSKPGQFLPKLKGYRPEAVELGIFGEYRKQFQSSICSALKQISKRKRLVIYGASTAPLILNEEIYQLYDSVLVIDESPDALQDCIKSVAQLFGSINIFRKPFSTKDSIILERQDDMESVVVFAMKLAKFPFELDSSVVLGSLFSHSNCVLFCELEDEYINSVDCDDDLTPELYAHSLDKFENYLRIYKDSQEEITLWLLSRLLRRNTMNERNFEQWKKLFLSFDFQKVEKLIESELSSFYIASASAH